MFAAEQAAIFEAQWCCVLRAADLAGPGQFRTVALGRESVIVTRDAGGALHALLNVCRHRGARVCPEESGTVRRNFRCSYHSRGYAGGGVLVPSEHHLAGFHDWVRSAVTGPE